MVHRWTWNPETWIHSSLPGQQTRVQRDEDVYLLCLRTWQLDYNTCIYEHFRFPASPHAKKKKMLAQTLDSNFSTTASWKVGLERGGGCLETWTLSRSDRAPLLCNPSQSLNKSTSKPRPGNTGLAAAQLWWALKALFVFIMKRGPLFWKDSSFF